jgi:TRAP-type C4-dicarboxylate transport system substrate-binding protein
MIVAVGACSAIDPGGDKAGGPVPIARMHVGTIATGIPEGSNLGRFLDRLSARSHGGMVVSRSYGWGAGGATGEAQIVRAVADDRLDVGIVAARVFDTLGVGGLRALSAPMLIDSYPLEQQVLDSAVPQRMLASLGALHIVGFALIADRLSHPISVGRPLTSPDRWAGLTFGTFASSTQAQAVSALGATPMFVIGNARSLALAAGRIQGFEYDVTRYSGAALESQAKYVVANLVLWPQMVVLIANPRWLAVLTPQQRRWLHQAADDVASRSVEVASNETGAVEAACAAGARFATSTSGELRAYRHTFGPVYTALNQDPLTRDLLHQIELLKPTTATTPDLPIPDSCRLPHVTTRARLGGLPAAGSPRPRG